MRVREWSSVEFDRHYTDQAELQKMVKAILENADEIENKPTPGLGDNDISRVISARSSIFKDTRYVIHIWGFKVTHITEIVEG